MDKDLMPKPTNLEIKRGQDFAFNVIKSMALSNMNPLEIVVSLQFILGFIIIQFVPPTKRIDFLQVIIEKCEELKLENQTDENKQEQSEIIM